MAEIKQDTRVEAYHEIAQELNRRGITTTRAKAWAYASVRNALRERKTKKCRAEGQGTPLAFCFVTGTFPSPWSDSSTPARPMIARLQSGGLSLRGMAAELKRNGIMMPLGKEWTATAVKNAMAR